MLSDEVMDIGGKQVPYFRTEEFSQIMYENECFMKKLSGSAETDRVVFLTGSGTAAMEASIINTLNENDKALIVNGGSFGERFVQICSIHKIPFDEIKIKPGRALTEEMLYAYDNKGYTAFIVNIHETSTGVLYDHNIITSFCRKNNLFLIVDAISSFLADDINVQKMEIDVMITGSQKALACPPGISIIVLSEKAINRIQHTDSKCIYLNLQSALKNGERGQTPFTPAVGTLIQINSRLKSIILSGGASSEVSRIHRLALDFREKIKGLPLFLFAEMPSNAVSALLSPDFSAQKMFTKLKNEYQIWICPNGGELGETVFRVGHLGALSERDNDILVHALQDIFNRNLT